MKVGAVSLAGGVLPLLTQGQLQAEPARAAVADSVIFLWMAGGVTHIDSFDPKPDAPENVRGTLDPVQTVLPGINFNPSCSNMARLADQISLVRTFSHDSDDHLLSQVYTLSGRKVTAAQLFTEPNMGSIVQSLYGSRNGLPGYIAVPGCTRPGPPPYELFVGGWLGRQHAPFCVGGVPAQPDFTVGEKLAMPPSEAEENLLPPELGSGCGATLGRLERRSRLRSVLDQTIRTAEQAASGSRLNAAEAQYRGAMSLLTSSVRQAFDLSQETTAIREAYGRTKIGGRCLMARRLVEAGARFVMVDYGYDPDYGNLWDIHNVPAQKYPHVSDMVMRGYNVAGMDRAFAALLTDMRQRGLLERTLVVYLTEFGRTPKINPLGGRDHWGACGSMFFAGAGIKRGNVVGQSDRQGAYPLGRGYGPADISATIYDRLGIDPEMRIRDQFGRPLPVLDHGQPIAEVLA